jgi:3-oxoacyl-ACP reductase-like protein
MGILNNIFRKIFPSSHPAVAAKPAAPATAPAPAAPAPAAPAPAAPAAAIEMVDVEAILNAKAQQAGQPLNWRTSIVDLMKLLDIDSSLQARKELAQELHYSGDTGDSASMNIWLHRQVMNKLAANGGKVPADLKD